MSLSTRGKGVGNHLMRHAAGSMEDADGVEFGYLGCREEVVPFYVSCGWRRISAAERFISRDGSPVVEAAGHPLFIFPVTSGVDSWPHGTVNLRGRAW
ncbi:GNAT family N-acetyltransferase [Microbacterium proteolyticum]|uniref:GNAT family N-acetyltransferase n=1 Tax=Microbacterium proteolyticum TaxID=1572644 RepID=UPI0027D77BFE|nr:GNAT family N-acetyltransferase [Microbacterium proteolyticum]